MSAAQFTRLEDLTVENQYGSCIVSNIVRQSWLCILHYIPMGGGNTGELENGKLASIGRKLSKLLYLVSILCLLVRDF